MASDVDQTLNHILGEDTLDQLRQDGRYRRDVYYLNVVQQKTELKCSVFSF